MELHQLRYFLAAAELSSISRAADRCRVAQPSLSQQIRKLERELGVTLFDRMRRGVELTEAGRALLPRAQRILTEVHHARTHLEADIRAGSGTLTIGAIPTVAPYLLPGVLGELERAYPACEPIVHEDLTEALVDALLENTLDVAILATPVEHEAIELTRLGREPLRVVLSADHPLAQQKAIGLAQLRELPIVTLHTMHCLGRQISEFCAVRRLARRVVCHSAQISTLLEFVRRGMGVSLVPAMAADADRSTDLVYLPLKRDPPTREIALARRRERAPTRLTSHLTESLKARFG